jgi:hypothetical protein
MKGYATGMPTDWVRCDTAAPPTTGSGQKLQTDSISGMSGPPPIATEIGPVIAGSPRC